MNRLVESGNRKLVIDLARLEYIDNAIRQSSTSPAKNAFHAAAKAHSRPLR